MDKLHLQYCSAMEQQATTAVDPLVQAAMYVDMLVPPKTTLNLKKEYLKFLDNKCNNLVK
eukprot:TRINITY_DN7609_c0_g1_i1.p2 TRINITY_DN7609_c0_g1~~TRINITY_DN7609_c0_g1_i1.p2  ORF type:complete len:60 (+),score=3.18 TRINITY_DN7609_c0_g1_i1:203-382(+)